MVKVRGTSAIPDQEVDLLQPVTIDIATDAAHDYDQNNFYFGPKHLIFNHEFITSQLAEFHIGTNNCAKCDPASKFLIDPKSLSDAICKKNISWKPHPHADLINPPYPNLSIPVWDPACLGIEHPQNRPRGSISVVRQTQKLQDAGSYSKIARGSTASVLRNLKNRPLAVQEIQFKLRQDVDQGTLVRLTDFLNFPDVKDAGITPDNVGNHVTPSSLLLVWNPGSSNTKARLCVSPSRKSWVTNASINDLCHPGHHHLPQIASSLIKSQLAMSEAVGDLVSFYTQTKVDMQGALQSAVYLQDPGTTSAYPQLDPTCEHPLTLWVFLSCRFGYRDAGSLSINAKNQMHSFYQLHFPDGLHKMPVSLSEQVGACLLESYVDDVAVHVSPAEVSGELHHPTFQHPKNFASFPITRQADWFCIAKAMRLLQVTDFNGLQYKKFSSPSHFVQSTLNVDKRLAIFNTKHTTDRPDQALLAQEILDKRQTDVKYANTLPPDYPELHDDLHAYLGMLVCRRTQNLFLRPKPLFLRKRLRGRVDITIRNTQEFASFLTLHGLSRAQMSALTASLYCPQLTLNGIYSNVARLVQRHILVHSEGHLTWASKISENFFPILEKLCSFYFKCQFISQPRYSLLPLPLEKLDIFLVAFSDGSELFSTAAIYLVSAEKMGPNSKTHLLATCSKIQEARAVGDSIDTIPKKETYGAFLAASAMLKIAQLLHDYNIPITGAAL